MYFLCLKGFKLVIRLDNRHRLNEEGCTRGGGIVDKTLDFGAVFRLYGDNVSAVTHGNDIFLQIFYPCTVDVSRKGVLDFVVGVSNFTSDIREGGACLIGDKLLRDNGAGNTALEVVIRNHTAEYRLQHGIKRDIYLDIVEKEGCTTQKCRNIHKLTRGECCPLVGTVGGGSNAFGSGEGGIALCRDEPFGIVGAFLPVDNLLYIIGGHKCPCPCLRTVGCGAGHEHLDNFIKFKGVKRFFGKVHFYSK